MRWVIPETKRFFPYLGDVAATEANEELAKAATYSIGERGRVRMLIRSLQKVLKNAKSVEVRKSALFALSDHSDDDSTIVILKGVAIGDSDPELRKAAVYAIADNEFQNRIEGTA